jgi:hypothetical protein
MNKTIPLNELLVYKKYEDYVKMEYKNNQKISILEATEIVNFRLKITNNTKHKVLVIIPQKINVQKEARDFLAGPKGVENIIATAIVVHSKYSFFITSFFVKVVPPPNPTKIFSDELKAIEWLLKV